LYFVIGTNVEKRQEGFIRYQISVSGQISKEEFCATLTWVAPIPINNNNQTSFKLRLQNIFNF
jgi:hypothetical protein